MTKKEILDSLIQNMEEYISDYNNTEKWESYVQAWKEWRAVKGDE